jgi:hypothetical protein
MYSFENYYLTDYKLLTIMTKRMYLNFKKSKIYLIIELYKRIIIFISIWEFILYPSIIEDP